MGLADKLFGSNSTREIKKIQPKVDVVKQPTVPTEIKISPKIAPVTPKKDD